MNLHFFIFVEERESHYGTMGKGLKGIEGDFMGTGGVDNREKWQLLSKELAQKQELINRMMREVDEKSQALKLTVCQYISYLCIGCRNYRFKEKHQNASV
jgi:hypothetical protein